MTNYIGDLKDSSKWSVTTLNITYDDLFYGRDKTVDEVSVKRLLDTTTAGPRADGNSSLGKQASDAWEAVVPLKFKITSYDIAQIGITSGVVAGKAQGIAAWSDRGTSTKQLAGIVIEPNQPLYVYIHEVGHALGLDHPGHLEHGNHPDYTRDTTIMSYNNGAKTSGGRLAITPMIYDIAVIQSIYGANRKDTIAGDTYEFIIKAGLGGYG